jgi:hypothetical protein
MLPEGFGVFPIDRSGSGQSTLPPLQMWQGHLHNLVLRLSYRSANSRELFHYSGLYRCTYS